MFFKNVCGAFCKLFYFVPLYVLFLHYFRNFNGRENLLRIVEEDLVSAKLQNLWKK